MQRYLCSVKYRGGAFIGWQVRVAGCSVLGIAQREVTFLFLTNEQKQTDRPGSLPSVSGALEEILHTFSPGGAVLNLTGSSRTDAGVHALGNVSEQNAGETPLFSAQLCLHSDFSRGHIAEISDGP